MTSDADFRPTASWPVLRLRAELLTRLRGFFAERGFLEVETPLLSADTVVDRHLDPFAVDIASHSGPASPRWWLQTSPEFGMKRLMAAGGEAIYQITRAFRREEVGQLHNPEFTIVEWYRRGDGLTEGMQLLSDVCEALLALGPADCVSYRHAFLRHAAIDPLIAPLDALRNRVTDARISAPTSLPVDDRDAWLDLLLVNLVEPRLGAESPTILYDYPASQAALARVRNEDPPVAERFELYVRGVELANGYHELTDADALVERMRRGNAARIADGKEALPMQNRLLAAMRGGLPDCAGVALGFDRVVMLAAGARTLAEVVAFPFNRA